MAADHLDIRWPEGRSFCCTFSWDDGHEHDRRVVEIMNRHGCKGTFNLNSGLLGTRGGRVHIQADEVAGLYRGHEVAVHGVSHPWPSRVPPLVWLREVLDDKARLEDLVGYVVRGAAWPFGDYHDEAIAVLRSCGIAYCRTTGNHGQFGVPAAGTWLTWHPTCHHKGEPEAKWAFMRQRRQGGLFYIWSHGFEMAEQDAWAWLEAFCALAGGADDTWHATNIQVFDYVEAWRRLAFSADRRRAFNPSAIPVWVQTAAGARRCDPGLTTHLA